MAESENVLQFNSTSFLIQNQNMPPKRKAATKDADETASTTTGTTTRAKRATTRNSKTSANATASSSATSVNHDTDVDMASGGEAPPKKKARTTRASKKDKDASSAVVSEPKAKAAKGKGVAAAAEVVPAKKPKATKPDDDLKPGTYTFARADDFFDKYRDNSPQPDPQDEINVISPEGLMELFAAAQMPLDGARPLLFAWMCKAKKMGSVFLQEWRDCMQAWHIDTAAKLGLATTDIEALLLSPSPSPNQIAVAHGKDPYNRALLLQMSRNRDQSLKDLYMYLFALSKMEGARNIDIETAVALWTVILAPRYPIIVDLLAYIADANGDDKEDEDPKPVKVYKGITKDQWQMTWSFVTTVKPDLSDYDPDGGWPTLLDEFVAWKKTH